MRIKTMLAVTAALSAITFALAGCELEEAPTPVQGADEGTATGSKSTKPKKPVLVQLRAKRARAVHSVLSDGSPMSCVSVTVTNRRKTNLSVNPLYFSLTDSKKTKHETTDTLGMYKGQIGTTTLAPGENAKGIVCGAGRYVVSEVAMTNTGLQETARVKVS